jgi:putative holliday junction resolvase
MKFMGVDYGLKRIGIAISDDGGKLAFPQGTISNDSKAFGRIEEIFKNSGGEEIVVGESVNMSGEPNALSARIEVFIKELDRRLKVPIRKQKEFFTTVEARRSLSDQKPAGKNKKIPADASAAALILQRYLDRLNKK